MECLIGKKFNRLLVLSKNSKTKSGNTKYLCICDCGNKSIVNGSKLKNQTTKSCGCFRRDQNTTHGLSTKNKREYSSWQNMKSRCSNPNATQYKDYGGSGVRVCKRWHSFKNFFDDMGDRPKGKTLDRINCYGNYTPNNCKWSTYSEQQYNRKNRKK